ncbi:MAG: hypothetical protein EHM55_10370, partial [Acidobacteria bacterium]
SELLGRSRQEAAKFIERVTSGHRPIDPSALLREHAPAMARPAAAIEILRGTAPRRFFAGVENPRRVGQLVPGHRAAVLKNAAANVQGRFDLLGYRTLWFGEPIDWHFDPVTSRCSPRGHWTQLDPLDSATVGDSKVIWELNRHQWIAGLAQAYALTGHEPYAERALAALESWVDANPYGLGLNWSSSLEVSYRVMSWAWTLMLLRDSAALSADRITLALGWLWLHASYVARYLSTYFSPNTHLTGEALGLFYAGTLFPEFRQARRWREMGRRVLVEESRSQICPDGVHFERSTCYHRYTLETYLQFLVLADRNGLKVPRHVGDRVRRGLEFLLSIRRPDGSLPEIGDADGGRLLPLVERDPCDPRGVFALGATMFRRSDLAWAAEGLAADVPWLTGEAGAAKFSSLKPSAPAGPMSRIFPSGGFIVMRTAWERDAHQMIVDVGPLGCSFSSGHGHADLLSVQCSAFGEPVLVDAGTYCYTPEREWRNFFRGTAAHSTLMIAGRDQVQPDGPFSWRGRARVDVREWRSSSHWDFVDASHQAYAGLTHRRRVLFVKPDYWVIVDEVFPENGSGILFPEVPRKEDPGTSFELGFQFAPMNVSLARDRWAKAETPHGNTFWIGSFAPGSVRPAVKTGELAPIRGWISTGYGQRSPAPLLVYAARTALPWRSITLLMPKRGRTTSVPMVSPLLDDGNLPIGLELEDLHESILVDDTDIFRSVDH